MPHAACPKKQMFQTWYKYIYSGTYIHVYLYEVDKSRKSFSDNS